MPKPPAPFELHSLYDGKVQIKFLTNSHTYKVSDPENKRNWEVSPSVTGATDKMEKGAGFMVYAMSEAMKYMDRTFQNKSLHSVVEDPDFTFKQLWKDARKAHRNKSDLGKRVGTTSHAYLEKLLRAFKKAQDTGTQFIVPPVPRAMDIASELKESWQNIIEVSDFSSMAKIEKYKEVIARDVEVRSQIWQESVMIQNACEGAREFFVAAAKQGAIRVWAVETLCHSRELFISGRFDSLLEFVKEFQWRNYPISPGIYVADYKTSNPAVDYPMGIFPNHLAQVGMYDVMYTEEHPKMMNRIKGHLILGSSKTGDGFHPYVSLKRERNRNWAMSLRPVLEYMHQAEKELKGLQLYGGK